MATGNDKPAPRNGSKRKGAQKWQRPRGGPARAISELVPEIGRAAFRRYGFVQSSVVSRWPEIVGQRYAEVSLPESIRFPRGQREGGTLHLLVSGAHATLMQHISSDIIERVNRFFGYGAVSQLRFRQGDVAAARGRTKRADPPPVKLKPVPLKLGEGLRDIGDPELNRVLQSLADAVANSEGTPVVGAKTGKDPE